MKFYCDCVNWPKSDVHADGGLIDLVEKRITIKRKTFIKKVDKQNLKKVEAALGYDKDFRMCRDWHVEYFRSKHHDKTVYGFIHSAIEYVFK